jgi:excinuclease ABC subunit B
MKECIDTTQARREKQLEYNKKHNITPKTTKRELDTNLKLQDSGELYAKASKANKMPAKERQKIIKELKAKMLAASKKLDFEEAARLRDEIAKIKKL